MRQRIEKYARVILDLYLLKEMNPKLRGATIAGVANQYNSLG